MHWIWFLRLASHPQLIWLWVKGNVSYVNKINRTNKNLILTLISVLVIFPALLVAIKGRIDPFWFIFQIPQILKNFELGRLFELNVKGHEALIIIASNLLNLSPDCIITLPVGGLITPIIFYIIINRLFQSRFLGVICSAYISLVTASSHGYAISPSGIGQCTFLVSIFIFLYIKQIKEKIFILTLLYISLSLTYYTYQVFLLIFLIFFMLLVYAYKIMGQSELLSDYMMPRLILCFIVILFSFNKIIYNTFIPRLIEENLIETSWNILTLSIIFLPETAVSPYIYSGGSITKFSIFLIWVSVTIFSYVFTEIYCIIVKPSTERSNDRVLHIFCFSIFLLSFFEIITYLIRGTLIFRIILLFAPIISLAHMGKTKKINFKSTFTFLVILFCSFSYFYLTYIEDYRDEPIHIAPGINWLYSGIKSKDTFILADNLYTLGSIKVSSIRHYKIITSNSIDSSTYKYIAESKKTPPSPLGNNYFVMDAKHSNEPLYGFEWIRYNPLSYYEHEINNNINLNKIYSDKLVNIYLFN